MQSTITLYNTALARLGGHQLERVNSPDDDGTVPTLCRTLLPHVIDLTLAAHDWSFAMRRVTLAQKPEQGPPGYPLRYGLPSDCLYPVRLEGEIKDHFPPRYILEGLDLLTDTAGAVLVYVPRLRDPDRFPPLFADAVTWALAAELSTALINDVRRQQMCMQQYELALHKAMAADRKRQHPKTYPGPWIEARE